MAGIRYKGQIFSGAAAFGTADHVAYDNTESILDSTDVQAALDELGGFADRAIKVYGDAGGSGYTDFNNFPSGTVFWANNTGSNPYANAPGTSAYHVLTAWPLSSHKFQIAINYTGNGLYRRTCVDGTWRAWNNVLEDTGELTLTPKYGATVHYRKLNGIVSVYLPNTQLTGMTASTDNVLGTIPVGYRPRSLSSIARLYGNNGFAYVSENGNVVVSPAAATQYVGFSFTYIPVT